MPITRRLNSSNCQPDERGAGAGEPSRAQQCGQTFDSGLTISWPQAGQALIAGGCLVAPWASSRWPGVLRSGSQGSLPFDGSSSRGVRRPVTRGTHSWVRRPFSGGWKRWRNGMSERGLRTSSATQMGSAQRMDQRDGKPRLRDRTLRCRACLRRRAAVLSSARFRSSDAPDSRGLA